MAYGFDSIKLDGCGAQRDLQLYADLFNATGKSILIENCHWGGTVPNATWCPWNYFRTSGDISASYDSVVGNLQTTIQWAKSGLSKPGCWGYPDSESSGASVCVCVRCRGRRGGGWLAIPAHARTRASCLCPVCTHDEIST